VANRSRSRINRDRNGGNHSRGSFYRDSSSKTPHGCILLYGPPGCGKTNFLKSTAVEFQLPMELIDCRMLKEDLNEGVKTHLFLKKLFARARESAPSMIILDEIDEVTSRRSLRDVKIRKGIFQLLRELDNIKPGDRLLITATSDRPYLIEPLLFKAKRFDKLIFVPIPNTESRQELFELYLKDIPTEEDINTKGLARITRGYNGHDIEKIVKYAVHMARDENADLNQDHLESSIKDIHPSLTPRILDPIKKFFMRYKSGSLWSGAGRASTGGMEYSRRRRGSRRGRGRRRPGATREEIPVDTESVFEIDEDNDEVEFEIDEGATETAPVDIDWSGSDSDEDEYEEDEDEDDEDDDDFEVGEIVDEDDEEDEELDEVEDEDDDEDEEEEIEDWD